MSLLEIIMLAFGLAMDAFAVAITIGLTIQKFDVKKALIVGLYFGVFQAGMPVAGYFVGGLFSDFMAAFSDWVAFGLLAFLGGKMIWGSFRKDSDDVKDEASLGFTAMLPLAVATSIDAMAVGVSLAFLQVDIITSALAIGVITLVLSGLGVWIGNIFGAKFKNKAESAGGIILVLIGLRILLG